MGIVKKDVFEGLQPRELCQNAVPTILTDAAQLAEQAVETVNSAKAKLLSEGSPTEFVKTLVQGMGPGLGQFLKSLDHYVDCIKSQSNR